jgi:hypothetical protein
VERITIKFSVPLACFGAMLTLLFDNPAQAMPIAALDQSIDTMTETVAAVVDRPPVRHSGAAVAGHHGAAVVRPDMRPGGVAVVATAAVYAPKPPQRRLCWYY